MRLFAVSILSVFVTLPALSAARLPVVNVASGGVSARAAFGGVSSQDKVSVAKNMYGTVPENTPSVTVAPAPRSVVARPQNVANVNNATNKPADKDIGEKIVQTEVLSPRRPSTDLWAQNDTPLRIPNANEFAVIRSDAALPEESLDSFSVATNRTSGSNAARTTSVSARPVVASNRAASPMSEFDAQMVRLTELQRRADASLNSDMAAVTHDTNSVNQIADTAIYRDDAPRVVASRSVVGHVPTDSRAESSASAPVKLSRLVVPMDDDVVTRTIKKTESPRITSVREDMTKLSPTELRQAFRKTFLSENKHLSTYQIDDRFDAVSDMGANMEGFTARHDLSEEGGIRPLEIKIKFRNADSALSRENYNLLSEYAGIVLNNPMRAIQVGIPQSATLKSDDKKLAARRLAIVEQVLRDAGVSEQRIMPVLTQRNDDSFVLRIISGDMYETMTQRQKNLFGDTVKKKTYKSMAW